MQFRIQQPDPKPLISQVTFTASVEYHNSEIAKLEKQIAEHNKKIFQLMHTLDRTVQIEA